MKRNCNLELGLVTPSVSFHSSHHINAQYPSMLNEKEEKMTIFYKGRVATCDVTELQAQAIISFASREIEEKSNTSSSSSPICNTMKRSLRRFLEKRKSRVQATSPYPPIHNYKF